MAKVQKLSKGELLKDYPAQARLYPTDFAHPLYFLVINKQGSTFVYPREVKAHKKPKGA